MPAGKDLCHERGPSEVLFVRPGFVWRAAALLLALGAIGGFVVLNAALEPAGVAQAQEDPTPPPGTGEDGLPGGGEDELGGGGEGLDGGGPPPEINCFAGLSQPGYPRSWEAAIPVSTYGVANAVNRNILHTIPFVSWSGVGPDMEFVLYHNSATVNSTLPLQDGVGRYSLGPGWRSTFSAQVIPVPSIVDPNKDDMLVVLDDGTQWRFTPSFGESWLPPDGVDANLLAERFGFKLEFRDGSYQRFRLEPGGVYYELREVGDPFDNKITVYHQTLLPAWWHPAYRGLHYVQDAAGRILSFQYDAEYRLAGVLDIAEIGGDDPERWWILSYDGSNRINKIRFPAGTVSQPFYRESNITYDSAGRIASIGDASDPNADPPEAPRVYSYTYFGLPGLLETVTDPVGGTQLTQSFLTTCNVGHILTTYTDRRGKAWQYAAGYDADPMVQNDALLWTVNPLQQQDTYTFTDKRLTQYQNALNQTWTFAYDISWNLIRLQDPVGAAANPPYWREWTYNWAQHAVLSYTPASSMPETTITYQYNPAFPRLLTSITEPAVPGGGTAVTTFEYYLYDPGRGYSDPESQGKHGLLKRVTDPNGVVTNYDYDQWGQQSEYSEGDLGSPLAGFQPVYRRHSSNDAASRSRYSYDNGTAAFLAWTLENMLGNVTCGDSPLAGGGPSTCGPAPAPAWFPALPANAVPMPLVFGNIISQEQDAFGAVRALESEVLAYEGEVPVSTETRNFGAIYNKYAEVAVGSIVSDEYEPGSQAQTRSFSYNHDYANGQLHRTGPDGVVTSVYTDDAGRVAYVRRGPVGAPLLEATYTYYANGLLQHVQYGNTGFTDYTYDDAGRVISIAWYVPGGTAVYRKQEYAYTDDGLPSTLTEKDLAETVLAETHYYYDARRRLERETRTGYGAYDLEYEYDNGGNRLRKTDFLNDREDLYTYDYQNPGLYGSFNNRLMYYVTYNTSGQEPVEVGRTYYYYNTCGSVTRIVTAPAGSIERSAVRFVYAKNGSAVSFVLGETWQEASPNNYQVTFAREFRYDGGRQRYLDRQLNTQILMATGDRVATSETWTDYDGDEPYGDFEVVHVPSFAFHNTRSYEPGVGEVGDPLGTPERGYVYPDHLGTTRLKDVESFPDERVYTAFGELVSGPRDRYGYAGAHGYQSHGEFPFLHVGHRYYDPTTGRFLQRDPIGIAGGQNVYEYALNLPVFNVDPDGLHIADYFDRFGWSAIEAGTFGGAAAMVCAITPALQPVAVPIGAASGALVVTGFVSRLIGKFLRWLL